jgi:hypothetical protein
MVTTKLYVEGGGDSKALRIECRRGFSEFLKKAGLAGRMPRIVACGGRQNAYESFRVAVERTSIPSLPLLLVDAEEAVEGEDPWEHLRHRDRWERPSAARDDQCHLMVQCMEAWFLADRAALEHHFGQGFRATALPANPRVEEIPKTDLIEGLDRAARGAAHGRYAKGDQSFRILAHLDPAKVEAAAPYARRFLEAVRAAAER